MFRKQLLLSCLRNMEGQRLVLRGILWGASFDNLPRGHSRGDRRRNESPLDDLVHFRWDTGVGGNYLVSSRLSG